MDGTRVIAFDPGLTTGVCSFSVVGDEIGNLEALQLAPMDVGHYIEQVYKTWRTLGTPMTVISESFLITPQTAKNSQAPWSLELIGVIRFFTGKMGKELILQTPAQAKRLITDSVLKDADMYRKGLPHYCDAARHGLYYCVADLKIKREVLLG